MKGMLAAIAAVFVIVSGSPGQPAGDSPGAGAGSRPAGVTAAQADAAGAHGPTVIGTKEVTGAVAGDLGSRLVREPPIKSPAIRELGGLDVIKIEKTVAPGAFASSTSLLLISRNAAPVAAEAISKELRLPMSDAKQLLNLAKTGTGQALLVGTVLGAGVITVADYYGVEGSDGFFLKDKYRLALAAFAFGIILVAIIRWAKG
jgi:hypothetical protein